MSIAGLGESECGKIGAEAPLIAEAIRSLLRVKPDDLNAYFVTIDSGTGVKETKATARCHFIALDGNKRPRVRDLALKLRRHVLDYSIPRSKIQEAAKYYSETKSTARIMGLENQARGLFTGLTNTGEGGEVLLYLMTETFLGYPQLLCKMPLKTSPEMHYHGADGIHCAVDKKTGNLALYWGESKIYKSLASAINDCFKSIAPFLRDAGGSGAKQDRDLQLLRDNLDLGDPQLEKALMHYLDPDDPLFKKLEYRAVCLVGFDSSAYPDAANQREEAEVARELQTSTKGWYERIGSAVKGENIASFVIEVFCVPFPSVEEFRAAFLKEMGLSCATK